MVKFFNLMFLLLLALTMGPFLYAEGSNSSSVYTTLKECRVIESSANNPDAEIDYFSEECPGHGLSGLLAN